MPWALLPWQRRLWTSTTGRSPMKALPWAVMPVTQLPIDGACLLTSSSEVYTPGCLPVGINGDCLKECACNKLACVVSLDSGWCFFRKELETKVISLPWQDRLWWWCWDDCGNVAY